MSAAHGVGLFPLLRPGHRACNEDRICRRGILHQHLGAAGSLCHRARQPLRRRRRGLPPRAPQRRPLCDPRPARHKSSGEPPHAVIKLPKKPPRLARGVKQEHSGRLVTAAALSTAAVIGVAALYCKCETAKMQRWRRMLNRRTWMVDPAANQNWCQRCSARVIEWRSSCCDAAFCTECLAGGFVMAYSSEFAAKPCAGEGNLMNTAHNIVLCPTDPQYYLESEKIIDADSVWHSTSTDERVLRRTYASLTDVQAGKPAARTNHYHRFHAGQAMEVILTEAVAPKPLL
ncbi:hypothetical protein ACP70R_021420 [Stipagrostis hirtigluma subsp. patula]